MKTLKDWYVQLERVKGTNEEYLSYLLDGRRHKGQEITPFGDVTKKVENFASDRDFFRSGMTRGGHIPKSTYSMMISFPFEMEKEDWEKFNKSIMTQFYDYVFDDLGMDQDNSKDFEKRTLIVGHKNNHCHFMLPKIMIEPRKSIDFSKKRYAHKMKQIVDLTLNEMFGISKTKYKLEDAKTKQKKTNNRIDKYKDRIDNEVKKDFEKVINDFEKILAAAGKKGIDTKRTKKSLSTLKKQVENGNTKRAAKTKLKIEEEIKRY